MLAERQAIKLALLNQREEGFHVVYRRTVGVIAPTLYVVFQSVCGVLVT